MNYLEIDNLNLALPGFNLADINIDLPQGKSLVILGPSGAGKSVLLETIAGFTQPRSGTIRLDGLDITNLPPETRQLGFMFQEHALFPHHNVRENVLFSLRFNKQARTLESPGPVQVMAMLGIEHLADRRPATLSGGEKQRVALARAMVQQPKLLLFDEPMSALDAKTREELQEELRHMQRDLSLTAIYVTHNHLEAQILGDFICIVNKGQVIQTGTQAEVFNRPTSAWAAQFVGMNNLLDGQVVEAGYLTNGNNSLSVAVQGMGTLSVKGNYSFSSREKVLVGVRPEDMLLDLGETQSPSGARASTNSFTATVTGLIPWGAVYKVHLNCPVALTAFISKQLVKRAHLNEGSSIQISLPSDAIHLIKATPSSTN